MISASPFTGNFKRSVTIEYMDGEAVFHDWNE
jgi:hypothetical protein